MQLVKSLYQIRTQDREHFGGKCTNLAVLHKHGFVVPPGICISTAAYQQFVSQSKLPDSIAFELDRKPFADMRWEEIWDAALRIRNLFLKTPFPDDLMESIREGIHDFCDGKSLVIRSSSGAEDSAETSFAGLHESYVNVHGLGRILHHIKLVWASLWSDRALMYRKELELNPFSSGMAVLIQELIRGNASGVGFSRSPNNPRVVMLESVPGLNEGLVDGSIEPYRWLMRRSSAEIIEREYPSIHRTTVPNETGSGTRIIDVTSAGKPPLPDDAVMGITETILEIERLFGYPVDVEWTMTATDLILLQARPITHSNTESSDKRPWYRTLTRSFENLKQLRHIIETEIVPGMENAAKELSDFDFSSSDNEQIASEIRRRIAIHTKWRDRYWQDCIPFAHGMRLFGHVYNDVIQPKDPYEFMELLRHQELISIRRNKSLWDMVEQNRLARKGDEDGQRRLENLMHDFLDEFEAEMRIIAADPADRDLAAVLHGLIEEMAKRSFIPSSYPPESRTDLEKRFLDQFPENPDFARDILDLGRASYRWRDDDNHYISRIQHEVHRSVMEGVKRLNLSNEEAQDMSGEQVAELLLGKELQRTGDSRGDEPDIPTGVVPRQLTGQPASPGMAKGPARVITGGSDLFSIRSGEILVCDAIKPEMTFTVPLAAAVVERRGGMLIHGAIIAREYGIPCITGIPDVTAYIETGDEIFVDAYVGIVSITSHR